MLTLLAPATARQYHRFLSALSSPLSRKAAAAGQVQSASVEQVAVEWTVADADADAEGKAGPAAATGFDSTGETDAAGEADARADAAAEADAGDAAAGDEADVDTTAESEVGVAAATTENDVAGETVVDAAAEAGAEVDNDTTGESGLGMSTCGCASSG